MEKIYLVKISFSNIFGEESSVVYKVKSKYIEDAKSIGMEIFLAEHDDVFSDVNVKAKPYMATGDDLSKLPEIVKNFDLIDDEFRKADYRGFVLMFKQYDGYDASISQSKDSYFWFNILDMKLKAIYLHKTNECFISCNELYFKSDSGKKVLALNNWSEFFYV